MVGVNVSQFFWFMVTVFAALIVGFFLLNFLSNHGPSITRKGASTVEGLAQG